MDLVSPVDVAALALPLGAAVVAAMMLAAHLVRQRLRAAKEGEHREVSGVLELLAIKDLLEGEVTG